MATEMDDILSKPCRVTEIELKGLRRTRVDLIEGEVERLTKATSLQELYSEIQDLVSDLSDYDAFSATKIFITDPKIVSAFLRRVELEFEESRLWTAKAKTFIKGNESGIEGSFGVRNVGGRGEKLTWFMEYGRHSLMETSLLFTKPRISGLPLNFYGKVFNFSKSHVHYSSFEERVKGISLELASRGGGTSLSYNLGWIHLTDSRYKASPLVQPELGHRLDSSVDYSVTHDERSNGQLSSGFAMRWISRLGGLIPHSTFHRTLKNRLDLQLSWKCAPGMSISLGGAAGVLLPLTLKKDATTSILDRFYLGGADSLKGFDFNSVGPSSDRRQTAKSVQARDYVGGDVLASAYASLNIFQRNLAPNRIGIYGHLFGEVGNVAPLSNFRLGPLKTNLEKFARDWRGSVGFGLVLPTPIGRFAVNYAIPIRHGNHDSAKPGLQMSFGTEAFTS